MPPRIACPNCGEDEWLENPDLQYLPRIDRAADGSYTADASNGVHVRVWRCNNCMLMMPFWEPD